MYGFWPADADGDDIVLLRGCSARARSSRAFPCCVSRAERRRASRTASLADFVAPKELGARRPRRRLRGHRRHRRRGAGRAVRDASTTTTTRSSSRRWPTGSPRRSPSGCTQRARQDWGYGAGENAERRRRWSRRSTAASVPRSAIPACPDHTEKRTLFSAARAPERARHRADRAHAP